MIKESLLAYPAPLGSAVKTGEFCFAAVGLAHSHIYGMCAGLIAAGATLTWVYEEDAALLTAFCKKYPTVRVARCYEEILSDPRVALVASAAIPSERAAIGITAMRCGKDYLCDKAPFVTAEALEEARRAVLETERKYAVFYSERCGSESGEYAGLLIERGAIGRVLNVTGLGPHQHHISPRAPWFYERRASGGILIDIGSHQFEQFLYYTGNERAYINNARIANYANPEHPEFDDFGDCTLTGENGAVGYFRTDWFAPSSVPAFGDGRTVILGTEGYIELRKYHDAATGARDVVLISNADGTECRSVAGKVGTPFFYHLIRDCIDRTETAMTQEHTFAAAALSIEAQRVAVDVSPVGHR